MTTVRQRISAHGTRPSKTGSGVAQAKNGARNSKIKNGPSDKRVSGTESGAASCKVKNGAGNSKIKNGASGKRVYGWNYKGPAILGRALEVDVRSIAVFRLITAITVLWDVYEFLSHASWFLSDEGSYSRKFFIEASGKEKTSDWSLYMMSKAPGYPHLLLVLHAIIAVIFAIGIRPRLSAFCLWIMHRSLVGRNQEVLHGGDSLTVACIVMAMFLPCDFYRRPDLVRTTRRLDMSVFLVWAILLFCWVGNAFDKWGYAWNDDYTATFLSFGYTTVSTKTAEFIRSTTIGWYACKVTTFLAFWVESLSPTLSIFPGGEIPPIRALGSFALVCLHSSFGLVFRLGSFAPAGIACAVLIFPTWFWDVALPFILKRARVYKRCVHIRRSILWLYVNRINPESKYEARYVLATDLEDKNKAGGMLGLPSDNFIAAAVLGKAFAAAIGLLVAFVLYPRTYTFVIALACAAFTKATLVAIEYIYAHWDRSVHVFWAFVGYMRIALILFISVSTYADDLDRWTHPDTGKKYIDPTPLGLHFVENFFKHMPARGVFSDVGMSYGVGGSGWHIAAGIREADFGTIEEFWPFTSSTSPFAPFYTGNGLSVPRPLSMDRPYLNADEYDTTRWEAFGNSKGTSEEMARYICARFKHLNLTAVSIYKIDVESTIWREKPYYGFTPPRIRKQGHRLCEGAETWGHSANCNPGDCAWDKIDGIVMSDWRTAYTPEKTLHERDVRLRTKLLSELTAGVRPKVRLRENFKQHRIGDAGLVTAILEDELFPVTVQITDTPDFNGEYGFHYHDLEIVKKPPVEHTYISLPNKFCVQQNDLYRYREGPSVESAEACKQRCSEDAACRSVEYYASEPLACQLSSTCDAKTATAAKPDWTVTLFVKVGKK